MRLINFNPGPARLPLPVLETLQQAVVDYNGQGISVLEISHRSDMFTEIIQDAKVRIAKLLDMPQDYDILFLQGGASSQFINIPLNFLLDGNQAAYVNTGSWAKKAIVEAKKIGAVHIAATSEAEHFTRIPDLASFDVPQDAAYLHVTSNNTIVGTQYSRFPKTTVPLVCDMSSDILSRKIPVSSFGVIYAGAQKNLAPAGVTVVIIKQEMYQRMRDNLPSMQNYKLLAEKNSLYNTPPVFQILAIREVCRWIEAAGGLEKIEAANQEKGRMLYGEIDAHPDFWKSPVLKENRSLMNVTFRLPTEDLEAAFISQAQAKGMIGLKGHRSTGGIRVSMYNALLVEDLKVLVSFMKDFAKSL